MNAGAFFCLVNAIIHDLLSVLNDLTSGYTQ